MNTLSTFAHALQKYTSLFLLLFIAACDKEPVPMDAMEEGCFVEVMQRYEFDYSNLKDFSGGSDLESVLFFIDKDITFKAYSICYETIDPRGNKVLASGMIYHPTSCPSKGVLEMMPIADLHRHGGGTDHVRIAEALMVFMGYTVIVPDLLGFGKSKEMEHPFLMIENNGRVVYDMRRAAAEFLKQEFQYELPSTTTIAGYSLGGFVALAAQQYYETHHANNVKIKHVYSGGGVYDLPLTFQFFAQYNIAEYAALPSVIIAYNHFYDLDLDFSQIFTGELLQNWKEWFNRDVGSWILIELVGTRPSNYLHPDFFKPFDEQNSELKKLYPHLVENSFTLGKWRPKAPISFMAPYFDTFVGSTSVLEAIKVFQAAGSKVSLQRVTGDHTEVGYFFMINLLLSDL
jgi:Dienelactone hydrolase and related enzymes